jgi:hypothetical protein
MALSLSALDIATTKTTDSPLNSLLQDPIIWLQKLDEFKEQDYNIKHTADSLDFANVSLAKRRWNMLEKQIAKSTRTLLKPTTHSAANFLYLCSWVLRLLKLECNIWHDTGKPFKNALEALNLVSEKLWAHIKW